MPVVPLAVIAKGAEAAIEVAKHWGKPTKKIGVFNASNNKIRVECTYHSENVEPGELIEKDWAFAVAFGTPDVTVWVNKKESNKKTVEAGQRVCWDGKALRFY
jgi:hypothetical protein